MALTLKGTTGSVSSQAMVEDAGSREIGGAFVTTDRAVELIMVARARQVQERPSARRVLMRDVLEVLHADGDLPPELLRAGKEIAAVWHLRTAGLFARTMRIGERLDRGSGHEDASVAMINACARFRDWSEWAWKERVNSWTTLIDLTMDVAVDGMGVQQVADYRKVDRRRAYRLLRLGLWHYAERAGWHEDVATKNVA